MLAAAVAEVEHEFGTGNLCLQAVVEQPCPEHDADAIPAASPPSAGSRASSRRRAAEHRRVRIHQRDVARGAPVLRHAEKNLQDGVAVNEIEDHIADFGAAPGSRSPFDKLLGHISRLRPEVGNL